RSVDLSSLLSDWCAKREAPAHEVGQQVQRDIKDGVQTRTDPLVLSAIVNNLLDNAISYSNGAEPIVVRLTQIAGVCCISVENSCEPMEAQDVEGMFEPFWRKRGTTVNGNHSGLGLALVRALCEAIRVTVHAQLLSDRRLAVIVTVPQHNSAGTD
ncbi:MAG: ATP-binding protein, partial [Planctomycetota bacterium]|nr:ATP-binding protein [Planctomycetota bacterium]